MPYEGMSGPFDLAFYEPIPTGMVPNDDLDLQVVWACLLDQMKRPEVSRTTFAEAWRKHIDFPWDEYGVCKRNLREGIDPPYSGSYDNWFINGMGAAIRSEIWACLAPGNPALAAAYAYEDACLDHAGDGIWAEVWLAAMQAEAFVETDIFRIIDVGFNYIPAEARFRSAIADTQTWWDDCKEWKTVRSLILKHYGHENFTNVTENMAFILLALLDGDGDFSRSICTAVNCGKDTDCTAATVGALLGIMQPEGIDPKWIEPIGNDLVLSSEIINIEPPPTLEGFTDLILRLRERLDERPPPETDYVEAPQKALMARIGFGEIPWFGEGWCFHESTELSLPSMTTTTLPGTIARFDSDAFSAGAMFVEYTVMIERETDARLMLNTNGNCRVFLNGAYVFGREAGRMAPSPHRVPLNQSHDGHLSSGKHKVTLVVKRPPDGEHVEWVIGIADRNDNDQWIPNAFMTAQS